MKFYVTYANGSKQRHCFSVVEATDELEARTKVTEVIGRDFAFLYDEAEFAGQAERYCLTEIPLQAQVKA